MRIVSLSAVISLIFASISFAAPISFETALGNIRAKVLKTRAAQVEVKNAGLASDIRRLSGDLGRKEWDVRRLKDRLSDLRRRAQRISRNPGNDRGRSSDPFFDNDLRRMTWDLRDLKRDIERDERSLSRIVRQAKKDPALVSPAQRLSREARSLESETNWLDSEARWARMDIRRAGYTFEAWDIERDADDIHRAARDMNREARRLLNNVR